MFAVHEVPKTFLLRIVQPGLTLLRKSTRASNLILIAGIFTLAVVTQSLDVWLSLVCWLAAIYLVLALHLSIAQTVKTVENHIDRIGRGDLTQQSQNEVSDNNRLGKSVAHMAAGLVEIVGQVRQSCDKITIGAKEIANGNRDLSERTESQSSTLEQVASTIEEFASSISQTADSCRQANSLAKQSSQVAVRGAAEMERVVQNFQALATSSNDIGAIANLIEGIAFQTNILALNAAVEAARAGEHGRGFAVVATEVRSLAQRASEAVKEIRNLIDRAVGSVNEGVRLVETTSAVTKEIVQRIDQVSEIIEQVSYASNEQNRGIEQIRSAVTQLECVTQTNANLVEELNGASAVFEGEIQKLDDVVAQFKLDWTQGRDTAISLVKRGIQHIRSVGVQQACDDFDDRNSGFIFDEFYLWVMNLSGIRLANGSDPSTRGQNIYRLRDIDGTPHVLNIINRAKSRGMGWQDYKWKNPVSQKIEMKSVYYEIFDDMVVCCGIYKQDRVQYTATRSTLTQVSNRIAVSALG